MDSDINVFLQEDISPLLYDIIDNRYSLVNFDCVDLDDLSTQLKNKFPLINSDIRFQFFYEPSITITDLSDFSKSDGKNILVY